jgi:hypothetical protein
LALSLGVVTGCVKEGWYCLSKPIERRQDIMEKIISTYFGALKTGRQQSFKNLAIYPLLSDYKVTFDYLTLDEALNQHTIEIHEIDKDGSVPELKVVNKSSTMVLILRWRGTCRGKAEQDCQHHHPGAVGNRDHYSCELC